MSEGKTNAILSPKKEEEKTNPIANAELEEEIIVHLEMKKDEATESISRFKQETDSTSPKKDPNTREGKSSRTEKVYLEEEKRQRPEKGKKDEKEIGTIEIWVEVNNVPTLWKEKELLAYFKGKAKVLDGSICRNPDTGWNVGNSIVKFASLTEAEDLINKFSGIETILGAKSAVQMKIADGELEKYGIQVTDKDSGFKVKVKEIPADIPESEIREVFEKYGNIVEIRMKRNDDCDCIVRYTRRESSLLAITNLNEKYTMPNAGKALSVRLAESKVVPVPVQPAGYFPFGSMLGGAPVMFPPGDVRQRPPQMFPNSYQGGFIPDIMSMQQTIFVEYISPDGRVYYYNTITKTTQWEKPPPNVFVVKAPVQKPETKPPGFFNSTSSASTGEKGASGYRRGPPGCNLFIFHLPNEWTEEDMYQQFAQFGHLISARIMTDKITGRSKGYGFVSYDIPQAAQQAVAVMNGHSAFGKRLKVELKKGDENSLPGGPF